MTKILVEDGIVQCPECGDMLQALYLVKTIVYIRWDEKGERWERGLKSHEESDSLTEIFCPSCGFVLRGDAIHSVEVETWEDKWAKSEMLAKWEEDDDA